MSQLRNYFLGPFQVTRDDKNVLGFETDKTRALLAYLVVEADRLHQRDVLASLLWPEQTDTAARQNLRQALYVVRQALGEAPVLLVTRRTVQLNPANKPPTLSEIGQSPDLAKGNGDTWCDVWLFNNLLDACGAHDHRKLADPDRCIECVERLQQATDLYRGEFLQGLVVNDSREFEEWELLERETLHRRMMHALGRLANYYEDVGEHERSLSFVMWQLKLEPWREESHRQAMSLLSRTGQRSAALAQYETCRQVLAVELGYEPARETTALYERIKDAETDPHGGHEPQSGRVPQRGSIHQIERPVVGSSLFPTASTPLIGREAEVTAVVELLLRENVRLLTVTGPGGVGKTRIAMQAAADLVGVGASAHPFTDGAYFVNLAPITDPRLIAVEIVSVLDVKEMPDKSAMESLSSYLQGKEMLLVLDNFEQVAEAAPEIAKLIQSASGVKALITSRVALGLRGAHEFPVQPMALPDRNHLPALERLIGYEGIRLFAERAAALQPGFEITDSNAAAVVEICHRLDGLPLAIELAAARIKVLPPQAMLARLQRRLEMVAGRDQDVPTRQQTLRNTIDWSYNLLDDSEKALFRRLAAFQGGWTLGAIEGVCSGMGDGGRTSSLSIVHPSRPREDPVAQDPSSRIEIDVLDGVESLISKSLLQPMKGHVEDPRFWMLETIHEYAKEKLWESGEEEELRRRHARYFMELVEQAEPHLKQEDQARWLEQLEDEHDNIRAAFRWARERGEAGDVEAAETGLRLAVALERFWQVRVYLREGLEQTLGVLAVGRPAGALRARALRVAATLANRCGEYATAHAMLEESLQIVRELGDRRSLVDTLHELGNVLYAQEDYVRARAVYEESLHIEQELSGRKTSLHNLGLLLYEQGDYSAAASMLDEDLAIEHALGDTRRVALGLANLGLVAYEQGDYALAFARHKESLTIRQHLGAKIGIAFNLEGLAMVYRGLGMEEKAAHLWGASQAMREAIGAPSPPNERTRYTREMDMVRTQLGEEVFSNALSEGRAMSMDQAIAYALDQTPVSELD